jgi:hypothetical protein
MNLTGNRREMSEPSRSNAIIICRQIGMPLGLTALPGHLVNDISQFQRSLEIAS